MVARERQGGWTTIREVEEVDELGRVDGKSFVRFSVGIVAKKAYRGRKGRIRGIKEKIGAFNSRVVERRIERKKPGRQLACTSCDVQRKEGERGKEEGMVRGVNVTTRVELQGG